MNLIEIFTIIIIHWIADFVLQNDKQAKGKSKNWGDLLDHTSTYSVFWATPIIFIFGNGHSTAWYTLHSLAFVGVTFIAHTITDYFTSRLNSKLWAKGDTHNFFVSIGFDQVLHYIQLFTTYYLLKN